MHHSAQPSLFVLVYVTCYRYETGPGGILWMQTTPAADDRKGVQECISSSAACGGSGTHWSASKTERLSATYGKDVFSLGQPQQQQYPTDFPTDNASKR